MPFSPLSFLIYTSEPSSIYDLPLIFISAYSQFSESLSESLSESDIFNAGTFLYVLIKSSLSFSGISSKSVGLYPE